MTSIAAIHDTTEFFMVSDDMGSETEEIFNMQPTGTVDWAKHIKMPAWGTSSYGSNLILKNHRLSYDNINDVLLACGQSKDVHIPSSGPRFLYIA